MDDTMILDFIERHVLHIHAGLDGRTKITWWENGREYETVGADLRDAVRKANGETAVSEET